MTSPFERDRPLAPLTTLELGGAARYFAAVSSDGELLEALRWADAQQLGVRVLGGGSNLIVADAGVAGCVLKLTSESLTLRRGEKGEVLLEADAGCPWQTVVDAAIDAELSGLECLTGIPGTAGATPIQNVGAYGQEVSGTLRQVRVLDRSSLAILTLGPETCDFAYRDSRFKRDPERFIVLSVTFALRERGPATVRYPELARALGGVGASLPSVRQVADAVFALRAQKSMVRDPLDPNRRSVGSFFTNPLVSLSEHAAIAARARASGLVKDGAELPSFAAGEGRLKLAAAWLIEQAGFQKGERHGAFGLSSKHALCIVHHGAGSSRELLAFAATIEARVEERFGVRLSREPVLWR